MRAWGSSSSELGVTAFTALGVGPRYGLSLPRRVPHGRSVDRASDRSWRTCSARYLVQGTVALVLAAALSPLPPRIPQRLDHRQSRRYFLRAVSPIELSRPFELRSKRVGTLRTTGVHGPNRQGKVAPRRSALACCHS